MRSCLIDSALSRARASRAVGKAAGAKHVSVLQHLMGFLKNYLSSEDKLEFLRLIEDYRQGFMRQHPYAIARVLQKPPHLA